jgi:CHAT domain-containing protein
LSFLPLHAAGDYNLPNANVFAYAVSSYIPTLTSLLSAESSAEIGHSLVAIGQEATPGHTRLPGTNEELAYIQKHIDPVAEYHQIADIDATAIAVLDAMEKNDWVHLCCHANQSAGDPTQSGFFLHDGTLDLMTIMQKSFKKKGLAFLSACQTAKGDQNLPDEAVHLASGMLFAGYPSVIATMWAVGDQDAPLVADRVYSYLLRGGVMSTRGAAKALHLAVLELRETVGLHNFARWAQFIHIGL